ncbi:uncharacterized protein [Panulirus ornatus]|uniref:uncharacterized protein isoform X2 n=1 Tax=Panulirus ornatus TaxID=150431 RepID=UPI003A8BE019
MSNDYNDFVMLLVALSNFRCLRDNKLKRVVCYEEFYSVIKGVHENVAGHASSRKTFKAIQDQYALIPREAVEKYCSICSVCRLRANQKSMNMLKPIRVKRFIKHEKFDVIGPTLDSVNTDENMTAVAGLYNTTSMCEVTVTENQNSDKSCLSMSPVPRKRHKEKGDYMEHISNRTNADDNGYISGVKHQEQEMSSSVTQVVEDEFDAFGRSIASQLRKLSLPRALRIQSKFQTILTEERICDMQLNSSTVHSDTTNTDSQVYVYWQK